MENLRWILIFAGVAILVLLYFPGVAPSLVVGSRHGPGARRRAEWMPVMTK